jgi:UDPglucose--hexose-1-phosphate uridylyltransferase
MSQFRKDPVSGEWVILAPARFFRPHSTPTTRSKRIVSAKSKCPFEDLEGSGNWPPILEYDEKGRWEIALIRNKFPALVHAPFCAVEMKAGPYAVMEGVGWHDLIITRDHRKGFPELSADHAFRVFEFFAEHYRSVAKDKCLIYLSVFGNWGPLAGASISHPHYQLVALPVIPPSVSRSLETSLQYSRKTKRCIHCDLIAFERKTKTRIIAENKTAIAVAPFASHKDYEVRIFPKSHQPFFERAPREVLADAADLLQTVLARMKDRLNDPDYNFFIHTAPLKRQGSYDHYHWHLEAVPKIPGSIPAGFELATGVDIDTVDPDFTAKLLR